MSPGIAGDGDGARAPTRPRPYGFEGGNEPVAILMRHHDVADDDVGDVALDALQRLTGRGGHRDTRTGQLQHVVKERARQSLVVHDQHVHTVEQPHGFLGADHGHSPCGAHSGGPAAGTLRQEPRHDDIVAWTATWPRPPSGVATSWTDSLSQRGHEPTAPGESLAERGSGRQTVAVNDCCEVTADLTGRQRRVLQIILWLNVAMFLAEATAGVLAHSTALLADSADMAGDALVYGFSLYVVARGAVWKGRAALLKGVVMAMFGAGVLVEVSLKVVTGSIPAAGAMGAVGALALAVNLTCLVLLWPRRRDDVNMRSVWTCSLND